jgi:anaerobic dimethyl sulfoxide reductase subunit A
LPSEQKIIRTLCNSHCGGSCVLKVHVKDGAIVRIETDDGEEPQFRACLRGRAYRQRVYAPDRLKYPMKRTGARGEGKFERISWDEALGTVANELTRVKESYGPAAILFVASGGDLTYLHNNRTIDRLLCLSGGYTGAWGIPSFEGGTFAASVTYGAAATGNTRDDLLNSRLIIMWGWDPANTVGGANTCWYLAQAREAGIRIVAIDPRYTDSAAVFADQWIPIRPGADAAMLIAMAHVIIKQSLQDQAFLDRHTIGFSQFKDYVMGLEDGVPKTPAWAEAITGVSAAAIEALAEEYATIKPAALLAGISPGRTAYGEQYHRAAITLAAMTGNIGIHGGDAAGRVWESVYGGYPYKLARPPKSVDNPVEQDVPPSRVRIHWTKLADAILGGRAGGYYADYKLLYLVCTNYLNQFPNINKIASALRALEFIVVQEQVMTPTAKFADILLPVNTLMERNDFSAGLGTPPFYAYLNKAIEPLYESKSHLEIGIELAERLGISGYDIRTEDERLREAAKTVGIPDYDAFRKASVHRVKLAEPYIAFQKEIEDPANNPFPTPSGKIEIYSQQLADMNDPQMPPIPKYVEAWESSNDPLTERYPLQLVTTHFKLRALSQFENIPWLQELEPQAIWISSTDAQARGIENGDMVTVFNDRGRMIISAKVTERIMPGVVCIPHGAWYSPDESGVDRAGCTNVLTRDEYSPGGAFPYNTCLVQVQKD